MGKVLKSVLIGAVLGAIIIGTGGLGAGLLSGVAAGLSGVAASIGIGLSATIAGALAGGLLGAAFSVIGGLLAPSSPEVSQEATGRKEVFAAPAQTKHLTYGETRIGGQEIFAHTWGTENVNISIVRVVSDREIEGFGDFYLGEDIISFDGSGDAIGTLAGFLSIRKYTGAPGQVADADLITNTGGKWTSAYVGNDTAYYILEAVFDQEKYPYGLGELRRSSIVVQGHKLYDPRLDSTVPGGSGSHRENDSTTWEFSNNAALVAYDYLRDVQLGCNIPDAEINTAQIIAAANSCDEAVNVVGGGTIPRYTADGVCSSAQTRQGNLDRILTAMGARRVYQSGQFYLYPAVADASSISLDEDDILSISMHPKPPLGERFNLVQGVFINPGNLFEATNYPALSNSTYKTEDAGETLVLDLSLPFTNDHRMAQRLSKIYLERSRQPKLEVIAKPKAMAAFAWSVYDVTWDNLNLAGDLFRATGYEINMPKNEQEPLVVSLAGVGEPASVFAWDFSTEEQSLTSPGTIDVGTGRETWTPTGVTVTEVEVRTAGGRLVPALRVSWDQPPQNVARIIVQYRKVGDTNWITAPTADINTTYVDLVGLDEAENYQVRVAAYMVNYIISPFATPSNTATGSEFDPTFSLRAGRNDTGAVQADSVSLIHIALDGTISHDNTEIKLQLGAVIKTARSGAQGETAFADTGIGANGDFYVLYDGTQTGRFLNPGGATTTRDMTFGRVVGGQWQYWQAGTTDAWKDFTPDDDFWAIGIATRTASDFTEANAYSQGNRLNGLPALGATENTGDLADLDQVDTPEIVDLAVTEVASFTDATDQDLTSVTTVLTFSVIKAEGTSSNLLFDIESRVRGVSGTAAFAITLERDTTGGGSWNTQKTWNYDTVSAATLGYSAPFKHPALAAGTWNFRIRMVRNSGSGTVGKRETVAAVQEVKK